MGEDEFVRRIAISVPIAVPIAITIPIAVAIAVAIAVPVAIAIAVPVAIAIPISVAIPIAIAIAVAVSACRAGGLRVVRPVVVGASGTAGEDSRSETESEQAHGHDRS